jgi:hypothetical protein
VLVNGEFRQVLQPRQNQPTFRIFEYWEPHAKRIIKPSAREAAIVSFLRTHDQEERVMPINYWRLPVPCSVILYLFILEANATSSDTRKEMVLARQIYRYLKNVIEPRKNKRTARFEKVRDFFVCAPSVRVQ